MREILKSNNNDLLREIKLSRSRVHIKSVPKELLLYKDWLEGYLNHLEKMVNENFYYLSLNEESIIPEILDKTQSITRDFRVLSSRFLPPIIRLSITDSLCLKLLSWLHGNHDQSKDKPFAVSDGVFSIYASKEIPLIYFLPTSSQQSLLHTPLFFHEFGHFLYAFHKQEMDDLVKGLQSDLEEYLIIPFQQNDSKHSKEKEKASSIIETWFDWTQELFCDAVGLQIGGPSYLHAFSHYLRMIGRGSFYMPEKDLNKSSHPISWLRVTFLTERAIRYGLVKEANEIQSDWNKIASVLGESGNYHGYYKDQYQQIVIETIDKMIIEANPISFADYNQPVEDYDPDLHNFIQLVNVAWRRYRSDINSYSEWEQNIFRHYTMIPEKVEP
ncbi:MAG: hypothetical protein U0U09_14550 [Cyclobacteriaceae bacterium]